MSPADVPGSPPPEVPDEFAEAYRAAYQRALDEAGTASIPLPDMSDEPSHVREEARDEPEAPVIAPEPPRHAAGDDDEVPLDTVLTDAPLAPVAEGGTAWERARAARWFVPALLAGLALVLVVAAYGVGKMFSGNVDTGAGTPSAAGSTTPASTSTTPKPTRSKPTRGAYKGAVSPVKVGRASANCVARPAVDASGNRVRYVPGNMIDGDPTTAWRCDGSAIGQQVTLHLPGGAKVAEVGLIPGYAKTDEKSGVDRYAENNRITKVRWTLANGRSYVQTMSGSPRDRSMRTLRVPATTTDTVTVQVLAVVHGSRNTTLISEVEVAAAK
jgi:hypothetical protein